ncbi:MAG: hypothetical protein ACYC23_04565, partial [Limisphaerales bacterium]
RFEVEATGMNTHPGRTRIPEEARMPTNIRMLAKELRREGAAWIETPTVLVQESIPNVLPGDDEGFIATAV